MLNMIDLCHFVEQELGYLVFEPERGLAWRYILEVMDTLIIMSCGCKQILSRERMIIYNKTCALGQAVRTTIRLAWWKLCMVLEVLGRLCLKQRMPSSAESVVET